MGRTREEGPKQLTRVIDSPRFQKVVFTKGDRRLPMLVSTASYGKIVAGFESRGFTAVQGAQE